MPLCHRFNGAPQIRLVFCGTLVFLRPTVVGEFAEGEVVRGRVVHVGTSEVLVDVGYKSEGSIPIEEFHRAGTLPKVGEEIEVYLEAKEDSEGLIVLSGEIDMLLDDGASTHVKAGDVLIQRGTNHGWLNRSNGPCAIAFITIDANPVEIDGKVLEATFH